jgi:hypothetical protein
MYIHHLIDIQYKNIKFCLDFDSFWFYGKWFKQHIIRRANKSWYICGNLFNLMWYFTPEYLPKE